MPKNSYKWIFRSNKMNGHSPSTTKTPPLAYTIGIASDIGKRRSYNEDSVFAAHNIWNTHTSPSSSALFVLADGMGGYTNGQTGSSGAIQTIINFLWPKIVRSNTLQPKICSALLTAADLIQYALDAGGKDNVSVLVAYIQNAKNRPLTPGIQFSAIPNTLYIPPP